MKHNFDFLSVQAAQMIARGNLIFGLPGIPLEILSNATVFRLWGPRCCCDNLQKEMPASSQFVYFFCKENGRFTQYYLKSCREGS